MKTNPVKHWVIDILKDGQVVSQQGYRGRRAGVEMLARRIECMTGCTTQVRLR